MHPATEQILKYFDYDHLPQNLQLVSHQFKVLAYNLVEGLPNGGAEVTAGLRKLLEAKDCFVRAALDK